MEVLDSRGERGDFALLCEGDAPCPAPVSAKQAPDRPFFLALQKVGATAKRRGTGKRLMGFSKYRRHVDLSLHRTRKYIDATLLPCRKCFPTATDDCAA